MEESRDYVKEDLVMYTLADELGITISDEEYAEGLDFYAGYYGFSTDELLNYCLLYTSFLSYANQYTKPFNEISGVITELQNALACAERIFELIDEKRCTPDVPNAHVLENVDGRVNIDNVSFSYTCLLYTSLLTQ